MWFARRRNSKCTFWGGKKGTWTFTSDMGVEKLAKKGFLVREKVNGDTESAVLDHKRPALPLPCLKRKEGGNIKNSHSDADLTTKDREDRKSAKGGEKGREIREGMTRSNGAFVIQNGEDLCKSQLTRKQKNQRGGKVVDAIIYFSPIGGCAENHFVRRMQRPGRTEEPKKREEN